LCPRNTAPFGELEFMLLGFFLFFVIITLLIARIF
jgi:hypothetical protein